MPNTEPSEVVSGGPQFLCLNCSYPMLQRQCKVRCPRCGYFEDCSDGMMDHPNIVSSSNPKITGN